MDFHEAFERLKTDAAFQTWQKHHPHHYLAHGFTLHDPAVKPEWQIGYYDRDTDRIIVFAISDAVTQNPPSEVFKKDSGVRELDSKRITTTSAQAIAAAEAHRAEKYRGHEPVKTIVLVQHLERGHLWNITFVTNTFSVCNIKLDTQTLEVLHSSCESLMGWGSAVPGNRREVQDGEPVDEESDADDEQRE